MALVLPDELEDDCVNKREEFPDLLQAVPLEKLLFVIRLGIKQSDSEETVFFIQVAQPPLLVQHKL